MKKLKNLLLVVASSSLLGITPLQADWQPVQTAANNGNGVVLGDLNINDDNTAVAIYTITQNKTVGSGTFQRVKVKFHPDTTWGEGVFISPVNLDAINPKVGIADDQSAVAVWELIENNVSRIQYSIYTAPNWSAAQDLTNPANSDSSQPVLAVGANGYAVAVWRSIVNGVSEIHAAYLDETTGLWTHTGRVSRASETNLVSRLPRVALDVVGNAYATWLVEVGGNLSQLSGAVLLNKNTAWRYRALLSDPTVDATAPSIVSGPNGYAVAVWQHKSTPSQIRSSIYDTNVSIDTWNTILVSAVGNAVDPSAAMNRDGTTVAVWKNTVAPAIKSSILPESALVWNAELEVSDFSTVRPRNPKAGISGEGNSVAVWQEGPDNAVVIIANTLPDGGIAWGVPGQISTLVPAGPPLLAVSASLVSPPPEHQAIAIWNVDGTRLQSSYNPDFNP